MASKNRLSSGAHPLSGAYFWIEYLVVFSDSGTVLLQAKLALEDSRASIHETRSLAGRLKYLTTTFRK